MQYLDPKTDLAFCQIFGSSPAEGLRNHFLNTLLYLEQPVIVKSGSFTRPPSLTHLTTIPALSESFLDVRAWPHAGEVFEISIQILSWEGRTLERLETLRSKATRIPADAGYQKDTSVVALTLTDFVMFPDSDEMQSRFVLSRPGKGEDARGDMELVFIELPKLTSHLRELKDAKEKWLYFLHHAPRIHELPPCLIEVSEIKEAFEFAQITNLTLAQLEWQERKLRDIRESREIVADNQEVARSTQECFEARMAKACEIAQRIPTKFSDAEVADWTNLPLRTVTRLRTQTLSAG